MSRPRLLDLFCGVGGAGWGYWQAGFDVVGVDVEKQKRYPFEFHQADVFEFMGWFCGDEPSPGRDCCAGHRKFDAIHASPPCQAYADAAHRYHIDHPDLIAPTRDVLIASGLPWVDPRVEPGDPSGLHPVRRQASAAVGSRALP